MTEKKLNSLDRFRKQSPRLILEQHSHCEVPAGCGGVVLRWRNPLAALPLQVHLYSPSKTTLHVDGRRVENTGLDLEPGPHVLAIEIEDTDLGGGLFMFAAVHDPKRAHKDMPAGIVEDAWKLLSTNDRTWLATTAEPPEEEARDWRKLDFADSAWTPLTRQAKQPDLPSGHPGSHQAYLCKEHKAGFLAFAKESGRGHVWVRRKFVIPLPKTEQGGQR